MLTVRDPRYVKSIKCIVGNHDLNCAQSGQKVRVMVRMGTESSCEFGVIVIRHWTGNTWN